MSVTVEYLVNGTMVTDEHPAERATVQMWDSGRSVVRLIHDDHEELVIYRQAERISRITRKAKP